MAFIINEFVTDISKYSYGKYSYTLYIQYNMQYIIILYLRVLPIYVKRKKMLKISQNILCFPRKIRNCTSKCFFFLILYGLRDLLT